MSPLHCIVLVQLFCIRIAVLLLQGYVSGFNFYAREHRARLTLENAPLYRDGRIPNNEMNKLVGEAWKRATAEERFPYEVMAARDKVRYVKELEEYEPTDGTPKPKPRYAVPSIIDSVRSSSCCLCVRTRGGACPDCVRATAVVTEGVSVDC